MKVDSWVPGQPVEGPGLWTGQDLRERNDRFQWTIDSACHTEILAALKNTLDAGFTIESFPDSTDLFPLPSLQATFNDMQKELVDGCGIAVLKGLPIENLAANERALLVRGIGAHLGICVSQNHRGERVGEVMDLSDEIADPRRYQAGGEFRMHIDPVDVVGLMCVRKALEGGESYVVSSPAVHNALLKESPDILPLLYKGYPLHRPLLDRGDTPSMTTNPVPIFAPDEAGGFAAYCLHDPIYQAVLRDGLELSPDDQKALTILDDFAHREDLLLEMDLESGDIQFLNNRIILHGRRNYVDHAEKTARRLMLRLWLMKPEWPSLHHDQRFFDEFDKAGGGIPKR
jgi:hypothetical protein